MGILKRESERQRLLREDMEMEFQGLKNHMSIMQAALDEAGARSADELFEAQSAREDAERFVGLLAYFNLYHSFSMIISDINGYGRSALTLYYSCAMY